MNPPFDLERYQQLRDQAMERALQLRRDAIDEAFDVLVSALWRLLPRRWPMKAAAA